MSSTDLYSGRAVAPTYRFTAESWKIHIVRSSWRFWFGVLGRDLVLVFFKNPLAYSDTYILVEKTMENFDILFFTWLLVSEGKWKIQVQEYIFLSRVTSAAWCNCLLYDENFLCIIATFGKNCWLHHFLSESKMRYTLDLLFSESVCCLHCDVQIAQRHRLLHIIYGKIRFAHFYKPQLEKGLWYEKVSVCYDLWHICIWFFFV